jgi:hypothetical protein
MTPEGLAEALHQLEPIGRVKRPRADQWNSDQPLPGFGPPRRRSEAPGVPVEGAPGLYTTKLGALRP